MSDDLLDPHSRLTQTIRQYAIHLSVHKPDLADYLRNPVATSVVAIIAASRQGYITPETPLPVKDFEATLEALLKDCKGWAYFDLVHADGDLARFLLCENLEERDPPRVRLCEQPSDEYCLSVQTVLDQLPIQSPPLTPSTLSTVQNSPEVDTKQLGLTETGQLGLTETEQLGLIETEQPDLTETEQLDLTETEQLDLTETEQLGLTETEQLGLTETQRDMASFSAAMPPADQVWQKWTFGQEPGKEVKRRWQVDKPKRGITREEVQHLLVYDVSMKINEENLPPAYVLLSSELAYKVARFAIVSGCLPISRLAKWWPANYTTAGCPVKDIEPVGRPAIVKLEDGSIAYGTLNGYIYCGSHGVKTLGDDLQLIREERGWLEAPRHRKGLGWSKQLLPDSYDTKAAENDGEYDFERHDTTAINSMAYYQAWTQYLEGHSTVPPDEDSPTHPIKQSYWQALEARKKARKGNGTWETAKTPRVDPRDPLPAIELDHSSANTKEKAQQFSTEAIISDILGDKVLATDALRNYKIAFSGVPTVFENEKVMIEWLESHGAEVSMSLGPWTTHFIRCSGVNGRLRILKEAKARPDIIVTDEQGLLEEAVRTMPDEPKASSSAEMAPVTSPEESSPDNNQAVAPKAVTSKAVTSKTITRFTTQTIGQVAHLSTLIEADIYDRVKANQEDLVAKTDTLLRKICEMEDDAGPGLTTIKKMAKGIASAAKDGNETLVEGYESFIENKQTMICNLAKAADAAMPGYETFSEDQMKAVSDKGAQLPGDKMFALEAPEAWSKPVPEGHLGLKKDLRNGSTIPAKYQTAPLESDEEDDLTSLHPRKKRRREVSPLDM